MARARSNRSMKGVSSADASMLEYRLLDLPIQILHVADCPLVGGVRQDVQECLDRQGVEAPIEEVEGPYPSPTLLVDGREVTEHLPGVGPACRLDLPSRDQITRAIEAAVALADDSATDRSAMAEVEHHPRGTHRLADRGSP